MQCMFALLLLVAVSSSHAAPAHRHSVYERSGEPTFVAGHPSKITIARETAQVAPQLKRDHGPDPVALVVAQVREVAFLASPVPIRGPPVVFARQAWRSTSPPTGPPLA